MSANLCGGDYLGVERLAEAGRQIVAFVVNAPGHIQEYQPKNQLDPTEDQFYVRR